MMSSLRFLTVHLLGGSLLLLIAVCEAEDYGYITPAPEYESDYNASFPYSFFSNTSMEDLVRFINQVEGEDYEEEADVSVTTETTSWKTTDRSKGAVDNSSSLPVSLVSAESGEVTRAELL